MSIWRSSLCAILLGLALMSEQAFAQTLDWGANGSGTPSGGTGNWNTSSHLWAPDGTSTYQAWPNNASIAQFGGTSGTVTLTSNITAGGITFNTDGYVLNGTGTLTLIEDGSGNAPIINLAHAGQTSIINTAIYEANGGFTVTGPGTLVLGGKSPSLNGFLSTYGGSTIKLMGATGSVGSPTINFGSNDPSVQGATFIYDNTGATGAVTQSVQANFFSGESTIQSTRVAAQNVTLDLGSFPQVNGGTMNLVTVGGTNGTTNKITVGAFETGLWSESIFFNGSSYATNTGSFVRAVNYGVDSLSYTTAGTTTIANSNNVQMTGNVTAQATRTFNTLNITGTASMTLATAASVTTNGILKSGGGASTISGGTSLKGVKNGNDHIVIRTDLATDSLTISTPIANGTTTVVEKGGAGVLNLTAINTYQGQTLVDAGTLLVNNATGTGIGRASTGQVYVLQGATLGGHGTIGGATEITSGATLSPSAAGNGAGTLKFTLGLQLDAGSTLSLNLGTLQDKIAVTGGAFDFSGVGTLSLNLSDIAGYNAQQSYTLIDWTGTSSHNVTLSDFDLSTIPTGSAGQLAITGNTLVLQATAAPEPSTWGLLLVGALSLAWLRRHRWARSSVE